MTLISTIIEDVRFWLQDRMIDRQNRRFLQKHKKLRALPIPDDLREALLTKNESMHGKQLELYVEGT